eukprot:5690450-Karenia_brevis.AAC.1
MWETSDGHLFCGSGGSIGQRGVAILIHNSLARGVKAFHAINDRLCAVDLNVAGVKYRFICAYMPHTGQADAAVEH